MRRHRRHLQCDLSRLRVDAAGAGPDRGARRRPTGSAWIEASQLLIGEKQPQVQFTTVEQIAGLAVFLASDTASNMQGTALVSDGGWTAQ